MPDATGARQPEHTIHRPVPILARIVWADDSAEHIDTVALGWTGRDVGRARWVTRWKPALNALKVEINATDGDAGLQIFLDGEPWNTVELLDPQGHPMLDVDVTGRAENFGLTELFSESSEPPFEEFPLDQFKELFPEGTYTFRGTTIDGAPMTGTATLSHDFPDDPEILTPAADSKVPADQVEVQWAPVTTPAGIDISGYQVLVVQEQPVLRVFSADVPATTTKLSVPAEFVQPRTEYKVEVLAIEAGGNQTLTELTFRSR